MATLGPEQNTVFTNPRIGQCITIVKFSISNLELQVPGHPACQHLDIDENDLKNNGASAHLSLRASSLPVKYEYCADRAAVISQPTSETGQPIPIAPGHTFSFEVLTADVPSAVLEYTIGGNSSVLRPGDERSNDGRLERVAHTVHNGQSHLL